MSGVSPNRRSSRLADKENQALADNDRSDVKVKSGVVNISVVKVKGVPVNMSEDKVMSSLKSESALNVKFTPINESLIKVMGGSTHGSNVKVPDGSLDMSKVTGLKQAVRSGAPMGVVETLIQTEAPPPQGIGAAYTSIIFDNISSIRCEVAGLLLQSAGPHCDVIVRGVSLLSHAITMGRDDLARTILDMGAELTRPNPVDGKTPLHRAAAFSSSNLMRYLLDHGADVTATDRVHGNTPLHDACAYCNKDAVLTLVSRGAELNAVNQLGRTPLAKLLESVRRAGDVWDKSRERMGEELIRMGCVVMDTTNLLKEKRGQCCPCRGQRGEDRSVIHPAPGNDENPDFIREDTNICKHKRCARGGRKAHPSKEDRLYRLYLTLARRATARLSLQQRCRLVVVTSVRAPLDRAVSHLGLPRVLQRFILVGDGVGPGQD